MIKRLVALCVAAMVTAGAIGTASAHPLEGYGPISTVHNSYCDPYSRDRLTAPDEYPHNIVKVLRTDNKAQTNSYVPVVFTFKNNNPFNVIRFLRRPVQAEEGVIYTFVHPDADKGKVLFIVPEYQVESIAKLCKQLDVPGLTTSDGSKRYYRQLAHRRASATDPGFLSTAASFSTGTGSSMIADPTTNALYFSDAPSGAVRLDVALTDWLDVPTAMVQMMVKIYEVDSTNDAQIGLDYIAWKNGPGSQLFQVGGYKEYGSFEHAYNTTQAPLGTGALPGQHYASSGHNYTWNYTVSSAFFDFLSAKGKARVMNEAKLAALNTWPASLSAVDQVLYYATSSDGSPSAGELAEPGDRSLTQTACESVASDLVLATGTFAGQDFEISSPALSELLGLTELQPVEIGVDLEIVPTIGTEELTFDIGLSWTDLLGYDGSGSPMISERSMVTTARMDLGDEIVLGGMKRARQVKSTNKMPILGSLPLLGYAFGGESSDNQQSELVIAIAPNAIMDYSEYTIASADQDVIDAAKSGDIEYDEASFGFDMMLLDHDYGVTAGELE